MTGLEDLAGECRHGLTLADCSLCNGRHPATPDTYRAGPVFVAAFTSECRCGSLIEPGDDARMMHGRAHHAECVE